uniref:GM03205p n=1 Tax=Drosophila melanogaster TaxID=7227 RepID=Q8T952_DROME|nr:GM03205p [Drosophila melanogaster]
MDAFATTNCNYNQIKVDGNIRLPLPYVRIAKRRLLITKVDLLYKSYAKHHFMFFKSVLFICGNIICLILKSYQVFCRFHGTFEYGKQRFSIVCM